MPPLKTLMTVPTGAGWPSMVTAPWYVPGMLMAQYSFASVEPRAKTPCKLSRRDSVVSSGRSRT